MTGLVGARLAARLAEAGREVRGLSRSPESAERRVEGLARAFAWGGAGHDPDPAAMEGVGAVVHLAGEPVAGRWTLEKRERIEASRVEGTQRIVQAIERADPRPEVLVSASAMGLYGDRGEDEVSEAAPAADDFLARVCVGWEREAARAEELGVRVVRLRIGLVLDADGGPLSMMLPAFKIGLGGRIGSGRQWWSWIHVDDLVEMIVRAVDDDDWSGPYNAVSPHPVRQLDFARTLAGALGRPAFLPAPSLAIKAILGDFAVEVLASRRLVPERASEAGFEFRFPELDPALADLLRRLPA